MNFPTTQGIKTPPTNISATIGAGVSGVIKTDAVSGAEFAVIEKLLAATGIYECFSEEYLFDVVTALSGSGPAFVFEFIKALADGAVTAGMPQAQALRLAAATVVGAGRMVQMGEAFSRGLSSVCPIHTNATHW